MFVFIHKNKKAQSVVEYTVLMMIILGAFFIFRRYLARAIAGRWKTVGDSFGSGRLYNPETTEVCVYDYIYNTDAWYSQAEYDSRNCQDNCEKETGSVAVCRTCILASRTAHCTAE